MARLQSGTRSVRLESIATPTADTDAANKSYVDDQSLDLASNGTVLTNRKSIANFDAVFTLTDTASGTQTTIDIADGAIDTNHLADSAVETAKINDDAVTSAKIADDAVGTAALDVTGPNSGQGNANQLLQSDGDGTMSWVNPELDTLSDVTITSPANEHMLSYNGTNWENSQVLQVEDVSGTPTLTHVFGRRLETALPFETFSFRTNSSVAPRDVLFWDEPLQSVTFTNTNNDNFQSVFVNRLTAASVGSTNLTTFPQTIDSSYVSTFSRTLTPSNVDSSVDLARDQRTGAYTGAAGGNRQLSVTMATNEATPQTTSVGRGYSWGQGGIVGANSVPGSLRFDATNDSYTVTIVVHPSADGASNISNVGITSPTEGNAPALQSGAAGSQYNVTVTDSVTVYHDTTITGGTRATFIRPTSVSNETASNRTLNDTGTFSVAAPTTLYPTWTVRAPNGTAFDTTTPANTLGTLSANGYSGTGVAGHTIALARAGDTSTGTWRGTNYGFNNSAGTAPVRFMIVAPSTTTGFTQPLSLNAAAVPDNTRTVQLGHSGHTVTYTVYEFTIGAGANFEVNPA